jgi:hypothetical protein
LNFAGSIDWAVDLQSFTADDMAIPHDRPTDGKKVALREKIRAPIQGISVSSHAVLVSASHPYVGGLLRT